MDRNFLNWMLAIVIVCVSFFNIKLALNEPKIPIITDKVPIQYTGKIAISGLSARILILRHTMEQMAQDDAQLVIQGANLAAKDGLDIKDIGNFYINGEKFDWGDKYSLDKLKSFVSKQMKVNAESDDTFIIFTVGHGGPDGTLLELGQRKDVLNAFAEAAQENGQKTLWWQLSCYAAANLPSLSTLNSDQQNLFSVVVSSDARTESPAYVEGKIMQKFFVALANNKVDLDSDGMISAEEMAQFLSNRKLYAFSPNQIIFGFSWARKIPIFDKNKTGQEYPKDFIPLPKRFFFL
jgi:hypothetical protein